ncbi:MAG: carbohydrate ABC transporter permease, partial [Micromonosporaceae bacterium]
MSVLNELSHLRGSRRAARKNDRSAYAFLAPWLMGLVLITMAPMAASLWLSFTDYNLLQAPEWVGVDNFSQMLDDTRLHQSLLVTFSYVLVGVPLQLAVALGIAVLLNQGMRGLAFYRSVLYLPSLLGGSVA